MGPGPIRSLQKPAIIAAGLIVFVFLMSGLHFLVAEREEAFENQGDPLRELTLQFQEARRAVDASGPQAADPSGEGGPVDARATGVSAESPAFRHRVQGRISDWSGEGIADATVELLAADVLTYDNQVFGSQVHETPVPRVTTSTDAMGRYEVAVGEPGRYLVRAGADGYARGRSPAFVVARGADLEAVDIELVAGSTIAGIIVDESENGVADASVALLPMDDEPVSQLKSLVLRSDAGGHFAAAGLAPGKYQVLVKAAGYAEDGRKRVETGGRPLRVVLSRGIALRGRVHVKDTGEPVPDAEVSVFQEPGDADIITEVSTRTDAEGVFLFPCVVRKGFPMILVRARGLAPEAENPKMAPLIAIDGRHAGPDGLVRDIAMVRSGHISGRVVDAERGMGLSGARVTLFIIGFRSSADDALRAGAPSDSEGRFRIDDVPAGRSILSVELAGWGFDAAASKANAANALGLQFSIKLTTGESLEDCLLAMQPVFDVRGIVVDDAGGPLAGARVLALNKRGANRIPGVPVPGCREATSDANGRFRITGLPKGKYMVVGATHPRFAHGLDYGITVGPDLAEQRIVLRGGYRLELQLLDPEGLPLANKTVEVKPEMQSSALLAVSEGRRTLGLTHLQVSTDADGRVVFPDLPPGTASIRLMDPTIKDLTLPSDQRDCRGASGDVIRQTIRLTR